MKKILLSILLVAVLALVSTHTVFAVTTSPEDTLAACTDGINNDGDLFVDLQDPDCAPFVNPLPPAPVSVPENTLALCNDGINNDLDLFTDLQDPDCAAFVPAPATSTTPTIVPENTLALCTDGINNDLDLFVDLQDPDCTQFIPVVIGTSTGTTTPATSTPTSTPENTLALCTDGINNDLDLFVDLQDPDCAQFIPVVIGTSSTSTQPTTPTTTNGGGGSGGSSGPTGFGSTSGINSFSTSDLTTGTPVSAIATSTLNGASCKMFETYMHIGRKNSIAEVTRLQAFLNKNLGTKISPTGFFGASTLSAVKLFQLKYSDSVLKPWVDAGLSTDLTTNPTGYVYLTTQRQINLLECPGVEIPMPVLK